MSQYSNNSRPDRLRLSDTVVFQLPSGELTYTVIKLPKSGRIALRQPGTALNRAVFTALGLDNDDIFNMAQEAFGYNPEGNKWPRSNEADYAAQCRLVNAIYDKIDGLADAPVAAADDPTPAPAPLPAPTPVPMTAKALAPLEVNVGKFRMVIQVTADGITISIR
jgi:hypothetical protein